MDAPSGIWLSRFEKALAQADIPSPSAGAYTGSCHRVFALSDFVGRFAQQHPQAFCDLFARPDFAQGFFSGEADPKVPVSHYLAAVRETARSDFIQRLTPLLTSDLVFTDAQRVLRQFRTAEMVRIAWRTLAELADLPEVVSELSALAEAVVDVGLQYVIATDAASEKYAPMVVMGLGKLGSGLLNFSSDIDCIFAYPDDQPAGADTYYTGVARALIRLLNEQTADGFVFRVDMRLRPYGSAGPIVLPVRRVMEYYDREASPWERYVFIKLTFLAGRETDISTLRSYFDRFVYRAYDDFSMPQLIHSVQEKIAKQLAQYPSGVHFKLSPGGIRSIEFLVESLQLMHVGRLPILRTGVIYDAIARLCAHGVLTSDMASELVSAYDFLRTIEHVCQMMHDQKTHQLPVQARAQQQLLQALSLNSWTDLMALYEAHTGRVKTYFQALIPSREGLSQTAEQQAALVPHLGEFDSHRLDEPARAMLAQILDDMLQASDNATWHAALINFLKRTVHRRVYWSYLAHHPGVMVHLMQVLTESPFIAQHLLHNPFLLTRLFDAHGVWAMPLPFLDLRDNFGARLDFGDCYQDIDDELFMERMRHEALTQQVQIALADLYQEMPVMVVSDHLTYLAEGVLREVLAYAWHQLCLRYGAPGGLAPGEMGFVVVAYGKLGGIELSYGSDLDLVFLYQSDLKKTVGDQPIESGVFYAKLAQRIIHLLQTKTYSGALYEIDTRLRPSGASGLLVSPFEAFFEYQTSRAWLWEHQALVRARPIAGDAVLQEGFIKHRLDVVNTARDRGEVRSAIREMREKVRQNRVDVVHRDRVDLNQCRGGVVDIEFLVQFLALGYGDAYPEIACYTDNVRILDAAVECGVLSPAEGDSLKATYCALRRLLHRRILLSVAEMSPDAEAVALCHTAWQVVEQFLYGERV